MRKKNILFFLLITVNFIIYIFKFLFISEKNVQLDMQIRMIKINLFDLNELILLNLFIIIIMR